MGTTIELSSSPLSLVTIACFWLFLYLLLVGLGVFFSFKQSIRVLHSWPKDDLRSIYTKRAWLAMYSSVLAKRN